MKIIEPLESRLAPSTLFGVTGQNHLVRFVAQQIGKFTALGMTPSLSANTDAPISLVPLTGDVRIHEI